jgi:Dyp-type peroxidase family
MNILKRTATNLRAGIDTKAPDFSIIVKLNIEDEERSHAIRVLQALEAVRREKMDPSRVHGEQRIGENNGSGTKLVVKDHKLNLLVGFGLPFFLGRIEGRGQEEQIPNFPPGGSFEPRVATRFGMADRFVPLYLRTMNASGDRELIAQKLQQRTGASHTDPEVDAAYNSWLSSCESDLVLIIESDNRFLVVDFWDSIRKEVVIKYGLAVVAMEEGMNRGDQRDHTGYYDGINNLQHKIENDPHAYRRQIYLPHPAPSYPGEPTTSRDDPMYDGGTYMVYRKYRENLDKWFSDSFQVKTPGGCPFQGHAARQRAVGRDRESGLVISRFNDELLYPEPDGTEVNLSYNESHILKARGGSTAPFKGPFPPLDDGQVNVFNTQDIRVRRRGANYCSVDPETGAVEYGLHFICFQNNIQQSGFEFINNIWLLNPNFRNAIDALFNPEAGVVEPLSGAYYFVPPEHRRYPGETFFENV